MIRKAFFTVSLAGFWGQHCLSLENLKDYSAKFLSYMKRFG